MELFPGDGCANRFLLVWEEELRRGAAERGLAASELASRICSAGDGVDGVLVVDGELIALNVRVINRDGSDGGGCLNGLRVAAMWTRLQSGRLKMAGKNVLWRRERHGVALELPFDAADLPIHSLESPCDGAAVDFWNPHAVFEIDAEELDSFPLARFAADVRRDVERFPAGVNVSVVARTAPDRLRARVDERGVGETAACGSGAVAIAATVWRAGGPARLEVLMAGGELDLERLPGGRTGLRGAARVGAPQSLEELLGEAPKA